MDVLSDVWSQWLLVIRPPISYSRLHILSCQKTALCCSGLTAEGFENCVDDGVLHASFGMLTQLRAVEVNCNISSSSFHTLLALTNLEVIDLDFGNDLDGPPSPPLDLEKLSSLTYIRLHHYRTSPVSVCEPSVYFLFLIVILDTRARFFTDHY